MNLKKWLFLGTTVLAVLLVSCAGVPIDYAYPNYFERQLKALPEDLLKSKIVLNAEGQTLIDKPATVAEFLIYMMASEPLERDSWISAHVLPKEEGSVITLKKYARGKLVLVNTINLAYQNGKKESRAVSVIWDDKRMGEKFELVTLEDKATYAALILTYFIAQTQM